MKQLFFLAALLLLSLTINAQIPNHTDPELLELYWKYKDVLQKNFLKIGPDPGESLPASARRIGMGFLSDGITPENDVAGYADGPSSMWWGDGTITLSNYIMVLATELKLLKNQGEDINPTA